MMTNYKAVLLSLCLTLVLTSALTVTAGVPRALHYQGRLTDPVTGDPLPGSHTVTFCIYDDPAAGVQLWCETQGLEADGDGVIVATLGATTPLALTFDTAYWLEVEVDGQVLLPRRAVASAAYALFAADSDSLDGRAGSEYALGSHVHDASTITTDVVSSISGVSSDGGNIELVEGENVTISADDATDTITIGALGGGGLGVIVSSTGWIDVTGPESWTTLKTLSVPGGVVDDYLVVLARWHGKMMYENDGVEARIAIGGSYVDLLQPSGGYFLYYNDTQSGDFDDLHTMISTTTVYSPTEAEKADGFVVSLQVRFGNGNNSVGYNYIAAGPTWVLGK